MVLFAIGGWGVGFASWSEMFSPKSFFGLLIILGTMLGANATSNVWKAPPTIVEITDQPSIVTKTTITDQPDPGK
jgi:hypothetical protein